MVTFVCEAHMTISRNQETWLW